MKQLFLISLFSLCGLFRHVAASDGEDLATRLGRFARGSNAIPLSKTQVGSYRVYTQISRAVLCPVDSIKTWKCGIPCRALPGMQVYASGGDGQEIPYWFVGYLPSMRSAVVAHQGTNFDNLQSVLTDFRFWPTTLDPTLFPGLPNGISVHSGFKDMHTSSASEILETVTKIIQQEKTTQVVMIGHSLGGALAQLDAALLRLHLPKDISLKVVTYEQPRVGNGQWANWYDNNIPDTHRITNKHDPVPTLPWKFLLYTHTQGEKHIVDDQKGVWYDCAGQDNPSSLYCSTGVVSNILKGNTSDHAGPYNGLYSVCQP